MNVIHIETVWGTEDFGIEIERDEAFQKAARELSDYIWSLPLTAEQNDRLVSLIVRQVQVAEKGGFIQGFTFGQDFGDWESKQRKTTNPDNHRISQVKSTATASIGFCALFSCVFVSRGAFLHKTCYSGLQGQ